MYIAQETKEEEEGERGGRWMKGAMGVGSDTQSLPETIGEDRHGSDAPSLQGGRLYIFPAKAARTLQQNEQFTPLSVET